MDISRLKRFALLRYGLVAIQLLLLFNALESAATWHFAFVLLLFINNQLRFYVFADKRLLLLCSFGIELVFLSIWRLDQAILVSLLLLLLAFDILTQAWTAKMRLILIGLLFLFLVWRSTAVDLLLLDCLILAVISASFYLLDQTQGQVEERSQAYWLAEHNRKALSDRLLAVEHEREGREELVLLRERNRISRDIHDSVGHSLSTMVIQLQAIEHLAPKAPEQAALMAATLGDFGRESLEKIRLALRELKPETYSAYELLLMLDELCRQTEKLSSLQIFFRYSGEIRQIGQDQGQALYWITKEFLTNASRHGLAKQVQLQLHFKEDELIYNLADDGQGVADPSRLQIGIGMRGMRERVHEVQGSWEWWSPQDARSGERKGFHMKIVMPLVLELSQ